MHVLRQEPNAIHVLRRVRELPGVKSVKIVLGVFYEPIIVTGYARPKGSWTAVQTKSGVKFRHASKHTATWIQHLEREVRRLWLGPIIEGPVSLRLLFYLRKFKTSARTHPIGSRDGDVDKLARGVLDALTGVAYGDDSQVTQLVAVKRYAATEDDEAVWIYVSQND